MDDGILGSIMDALEAALAVNMTDFDFSTTGQVLRGRYTKPPDPPFIAISNPQLRRAEGPTLGYRTTTATVDIVAWAPSEGGTVDERCDTSVALVHQVTDALDTARDTTSNVLYSEVITFDYESMTLDSDVDGVPPGFCVAWISLQFSYQTQRGL